MKRHHYTLCTLLLLLFAPLQAVAWEGMEMPTLHVSGRNICDSEGNAVTLHGFAQTYSPWFNEQGTKWSNYNVSDCLSYNQGLIDDMQEAGWKFNFIRLHMDPYWSNKPGVSTTGESDISAFDINRFRTYLSQVFAPMAEYAIAHGLYVIMRPPGVCPDQIALGDDYQKYLIQVWSLVARNTRLKNNPYVMFELANEPVNILGDDGSYGSGTESQQRNCSRYFQAVVDTMRALGCDNILWVPGLGYQSVYQGYEKYPIEGDNIGYAVHVYPGWYGSDAEQASVELGGSSGGGYLSFQTGWDKQVKPVCNFAPVVVTEMDWAPKKYNASWGKSTTGVAGGTGFGANFKYIADREGNVSWLLFTSPDILAQFKDSVPADGEEYTVLTDPEACPWPCYHWFQEYADPDWTFVDTVIVVKDDPTFPLTNAGFNPSIWETGTFDEATGGLTTGQYGFGGWKYPNGIDLSEWKYLVSTLKKSASGTGLSFRIFDDANYWGGCYQIDFGSALRAVAPLQNMYKEGTTTKLDPSHIFIVGYWTYGGQTVYLDKVYLTNNDDFSESTSGIRSIERAVTPIDVYDMNGRCLSRRVLFDEAIRRLTPGTYVIGGEKVRIVR